MLTLTRAVGVGSSAGPGSLTGVRVLINGTGVRTPLFGTGRRRQRASAQPDLIAHDVESGHLGAQANPASVGAHIGGELFGQRSEEHTSELQSRGHLVCRLLLEQKKPHYDVTKLIP